MSDLLTVEDTARYGGRELQAKVNAGIAQCLGYDAGLDSLTLDDTYNHYSSPSVMTKVNEAIDATNTAESLSLDTLVAGDLLPNHETDFRTVVNAWLAVVVDELMSSSSNSSSSSSSQSSRSDSSQTESSSSESSVSSVSSQSTSTAVFTSSSSSQSVSSSSSQSVSSSESSSSQSVSSVSSQSTSSQS